MCGGLITILNKLKVKKVVIGKQFENSENYEKFMNLAKNKNIKINMIESGQRINIEKNLYIDVLWPSKGGILENSLNNNSLVCKLNYNNFSVLFTGDIERIAEEKIIKEINNKMLEADVLKISHHGSKTSSKPEFLKKINPKIALIGVGKNNKYGHPNQEVITRLKECTKQIFRTDLNGEITININKKYNVLKIKKCK